MSTQPQPPLRDPQLEQLCKVLGDTSRGLSGTQIGQYLTECGIDESQNGSSSKWRRLYAALRENQIHAGHSNAVLGFLKHALDPVRYTNDHDLFDARRHEVNRVLSLCGYELTETGDIFTRTAVNTLSEAEERAGRLRGELIRRRIHGDVLAFCRPELLQHNYFHAVFEATKSIPDKIRTRTGLVKDGGELVDEAFGIGASGMPFLAFNTLRTPSETSEQKGLMNLMKGLFGTFRNTTAHTAKIHWSVSEQDALDLLTMASFIHRRIDDATRTPRNS